MWKSSEWGKRWSLVVESVYIAGISKDENDQTLSDWSTVPGKEKKQKPSVMLIGTSNIKGIDPAMLSPNINIDKYISHTFA